MKLRNNCYILLLSFISCLGLFIPVKGFGQSAPKSGLNQFLNKINVSNDSLAFEKLYIQTDKPAYMAGDTLWFKGYLLQATLQSYAEKSGIVYLELANDSNQLIQRMMLPVYLGMTDGYIPLNDLPEGSYNLRAYTNWMRNFGENPVFQKQFYVTANYNSSWLVSYQAKTHVADKRSNVKLDVGLKQFDQFPIGLRELQVMITGDKKTWLKTRTESSAEGKLQFSFDLPEKSNTKNLSLVIEDLRKSQEKRKITIPLFLNRAEKMDLQFLPEGGKLVMDHPSKLAFKVVNEQGLGVKITGKIYNARQQEVAVFSTQHAGMGSLIFVPRDIGPYTARVELADGSIQDYPLPEVSKTGLSLQVINPFAMDSCIVKIRSSPDFEAAGKQYYLVGMARNVICWGAAVDVKKEISSYKIDKKVFPSGVVRFLLIDEKHMTWNERNIYNDLDDQLQIRYSLNKENYQPRDSIGLNILVTDKEGKPVSAAFSFAVTDNTQVKTDTAGTSIISYLLLTSDLKGSIEQPGYYRNAAKHMDKWQHLDNLLLCQGWASYDWAAALRTGPELAFAAEDQFLVKGRVTNAFNKPVPNSEVVLISKKPPLILDNTTDEKGFFIFKGIVPTDTAAFFISAKNKRGKSFNVGIEMDEFKPPFFTPFRQRSLPWFVNIDTNVYMTIGKRVHLKNEQLRITGGNMLKEVVIKTRKIIKGSKNLNGPGQADLIIDEAQLEKEGKKSLGDILSERLKGFGIRTTKRGSPYYGVYRSFLHLVVDGVNTDFFMTDLASRYQYLKDIFDHYGAEDIIGIEAMVNGKNLMGYTSRLLDPMEIPWDHAFIEITTRAGTGPFLRKSIGTYVYKPMAFSRPKAFYSPKYKPGSQADLSDIRSTIFWEPNIITDKDGKANISFFAADNPGIYTLIMEGTDLQGHLGSQTQKLIIKKPVLK